MVKLFTLDEMFLEIIVCFLSHFSHILCSWKSSVMWVTDNTILGCFQGVSGVLVWITGEASPFPLCSQGVGAFSTPLWICSPGPSIHFDSLPNERLQQQRPMSHFVISGNRWTSPKPSGCSCIFLFLSGSWEVRGWFFSAERARLQIHPAFQIDGRGQTHFHCALCYLYSQ